MFGLATLSIALLAGQAAAAVSSPSFFKRQVDPGSIPPQCKDACSAAQTSLGSCGADLNCLCTDTITKSFSSCLECAVSLDPSTLSTMQESLNGKYLFPSLTHLVLILVLVPIPIQFEQGCTSAGHAVTPITLTAASGSSGTPTSAAGSSGSAASAPAATTTAPASSSSTAAASGHNGAGMVGASVASVAGAVGVALAALV